MPVIPNDYFGVLAPKQYCAALCASVRTPCEIDLTVRAGRVGRAGSAVRCVQSSRPPIQVANAHSDFCLLCAEIKKGSQS